MDRGQAVIDVVNNKLRTRRQLTGFVSVGNITGLVALAAGASTRNDQHHYRYCRPYHHPFYMLHTQLHELQIYN
jgi:hypothetical protein